MFWARCYMKSFFLEFKKAETRHELVDYVLVEAAAFAVFVLMLRGQ